MRQAPETGLFSSPSRESVRVVGGFGFRGWGAFTIAATSAGILSVAFVVWTALRIGGDQATIAVDDIGEARAALNPPSTRGLAAARTHNPARPAWSRFSA